MPRHPDPGSIPQPPLLLTKRVTAFLSANLTPQIHTACLATPSGNILAHASTVSPARVLRRQAAVAASLWAMHNRAGYGRDVEDALPKRRSSGASSEGGLAPRAITVQLEPTEAGGAGTVVVIRGLKCGILFLVLAGPEEHAPPAKSAANNAEGGGGSSSSGNATSPATGGPPPGRADAGGGTSSPKGGGGGGLDGSSSTASATTTTTTPTPASRSGTQISATAAAHPGSPSDSILSSGTAAAAASINSQSSVSAGGINTAFVQAIRRQAEEIARYLDEKLGSLAVLEESVGGGWDVR